MKTLEFIKLNESGANNVVASLQQLLADFQVYYTNLRGFHWNIKGHNFFVLHSQFEKMYDDTAEKVDEIAERILMLGGTPANKFSDYLKVANINEVDKVSNGEQALDMLKKNEVHLLIIDVMMPKLDGIRATLKIREESSIPIIILSAKSEDSDKILGLNIGADDYVTKPFNPLELVARVKSQLRRYTQLGNVSESNETVYQVGGLMINDDLKEVTVDGELVKLTPIEYNILLLLVKNQGKVFSIEQIYENIWNEDAIGADNTVAVHIRHIREKIEINPKEPRYLKVVWGVGYKVEKN